MLHLHDTRPFNLYINLAFLIRKHGIRTTQTKVLVLLCVVSIATVMLMSICVGNKV